MPRGTLSMARCRLAGDTVSAIREALSSAFRAWTGLLPRKAVTASAGRAAAGHTALIVRSKRFRMEGHRVAWRRLVWSSAAARSAPTRDGVSS